LLRGLRAFKHFLGDEVKCITDCRALSYIVQKKEISKKLERYLAELSEFNLKFEHRPREKLVVVDALAKDERWKEEEQRYLESKVLEGRVTVDLGSGQHLQFTMSGKSSTQPAPNTEHVSIGHTRYDSRDAQREDLTCKEIKEILLKSEKLTEKDKRVQTKYNMVNSAIFRKPTKTWKWPRLKVPGEELKRKIFKGLHDDLLAGHLGQEITWKRIAERFYWKGMKKQIFEWVNQCHSCQIHKFTGKGFTAPLQTLPIAKPWEIVQSDYITLPPTPNGYKYICVFGDRCTRYAELCKTRDCTAPTTLQKYIKRVVTRWGISKLFICDGGPSYKAEFNEYCEKYLIELSVGLPYRHRSNGFMERLIGIVQMVLSHYVDDKKTNWDELVHTTQWVVNTASSRSHKGAAYNLTTGFNPRFPIENLVSEQILPHVEGRDDEHAEEMKEKIGNANKNREVYNKKMEEKYNKKHKASQPPYEVGR
jgi:hypothetical protein